MPKYQDDKFVHVESDIDKLRLKTTMYISYVGARGALHLAKEVINNAIDESMSEFSPCKNIEIELDSNTNQITVRDDGRGIPFNELETICMYLQSGSNIEKDKDKKNAADLAGENGVGLTAVNALSEKLVFVIARDGQKGIFTFDDGKLVNTRYEKCKETLHGTSVIFIPSEEYLGKCKIESKSLKEWINEISYMLPTDIKITYSHIKKGSDVPQSETFKHKKGIVELVDTITDQPMINTIHLKQNYTDINTRTEIAFNISQSDTSDFTNVKSYCNRVSTIDRGTHVDAAKTAWCKAVTKIATEMMTESEKKKLTIGFDDCRIGLSAVIVLFTPQPMFTGQTKQKVDNSSLYKPLVYKMTDDLVKYFHTNPNEAKKVVNIVKKCAKARQEIVKIRKSDYKALDTFEANTSKIYKPCSSTDYAELWILEGDSALGGFEGHRDYRFQAGFKLKGNPKNVYGCTLAEILANPELRTLTRVIGTGIGKDFNINKINFKRIIFFVDSDIDGWNMVSLLSAYFLWCMPEIVEKGYLYRAMAPLYLLKDPKHPYLLSKVAYYELFATIVSKNMHLIDNTGHELDNKEMLELITKNKDYLDELEPLAKYFYTNHEIIEFAVLNGERSDFGKRLVAKFPELVYDPETSVITGTYNMAYQYLPINDSFFDKCKRLYTYIHETNSSKIYYEIVNKGEKLSGIYSLGSFFIMNKKYLPPIEERIKGIGELPGEILWDTTLNPNKRELIRLTCSDLQRELETVKVLHGPNPEDRKNFMKGYVFNKEDIDT